MKHYTLRLTDAEYALFSQIASLESSSMASAIRRGMRRSAQAHGLLTVTIGASTSPKTSSVPSSAMRKTANTARPVPTGDMAASLDNLFDDTPPASPHMPAPEEDPYELDDAGEYIPEGVNPEGLI